MEPAGLNRLKAALQPGDCVKVAGLDRLARSVTQVLELPGWLRENQVEVISLRESFDQDSAMGRAMLHLAIVFAEMERDLTRERTRWRGWSGSRPLASTLDGARESAGSGPRRYRTCAGAPASHGAASPR